MHANALKKGSLIYHWVNDKTVETNQAAPELTSDAEPLEQALRYSVPEIHHSDQGV